MPFTTRRQSRAARSPSARRRRRCPERLRLRCEAPRHEKAASALFIVHHVTVSRREDREFAGALRSGVER